MCECSASQFPRSRNRGRNHGISHLKRNPQCGTERNGLGPYLSFSSPPNTNSSRRCVKYISVGYKRTVPTYFMPAVTMWGS